MTALFLIVGSLFSMHAGQPMVATSVQSSTTTNAYTPLFAQNEGPGGPDCYYTRAGQVYLSNDRGKNFMPVAGADVTSFEDRSIYGLCFGTDKSHVYRDAQALSGYNPAVFKLLWYTKTTNGPILFFERTASSIGSFSFSEDSDTAYVGTSAIPNGDPQTFKELVGAYDFGPWAQDKNNVYCQGKILPGANPSDVSYVNQGMQIAVTVNGVLSTADSNCQISSIGK